MKRREFVQSTLVGTAAVSGVAPAQTRLSATPSDYEGPFYRRGPRQRESDLIVGAPRAPLLRWIGRLLDRAGKPIVDAHIEIWQTDPLGRYDHPDDSSPGARWTDFRYWGESQSADSGRFRFRTYVPGAYGGRPAHIHFKVWRNDQVTLTSQVYFRQLGGTQGASRHRRGADLQTANLIEVSASEQRIDFDIVLG
ncbi:MAG: intradiol ring-cleavage dioxygenase [Pseudomonadota bacterium]